ncbi:SRPBCC family protein [Streptantibioticus ferralitis]|uniref:SRPBCC family protein n=1 Tax=Streptantibioticus ferralitis TaxID=236510 RepID=A0ABT5Z730_9ACTN|nr:SRPBCC family protein [Streptantibioticus ferralitis]MDF2258840.1 SRPBCC family protein [Streptantibioticus ferralitis]
MNTNTPQPQQAPITAVDENAPVIVRVSTTVNAPLATVWDLHTDIAGWARWNANVERIEFAGPLTPGASFHWLTHGLEITSTLFQVVHGERIVWGGPANGIDGIHVWAFEEHDGAVTVHTEESWSGAVVEAQPDQLQQALEQSLTDWLRRLKTEAENR